MHGSEGSMHSTTSSARASSRSTVVFAAAVLGAPHDDAVAEPSQTRRARRGLAGSLPEDGAVRIDTRIRSVERTNAP